MNYVEIIRNEKEGWQQLKCIREFKFFDTTVKVGDVSRKFKLSVKFGLNCWIGAWAEIGDKAEIGAWAKPRRNLNPESGSGGPAFGVASFLLDQGVHFVCLLPRCLQIAPSHVAVNSKLAVEAFLFTRQFLETQVPYDGC